MINSIDNSMEDLTINLKLKITKRQLKELFNKEVVGISLGALNGTMSIELSDYYYDKGKVIKRHKD